jgi:hypothetical protein
MHRYRFCSSVYSNNSVESIMPTSPTYSMSTFLKTSEKQQDKATGGVYIGKKQFTLFKHRLDTQKEDSW